MRLPFKIPDLKMGQERPALLASIGLSLLIWFFVKLSKEYQTEREVRIAYVLPNMMEFTEHPSQTLEATLAGKGIDLMKQFITQRMPTIEVEIAKLPDKANQKSELMSLIHAKTGLEVININLNYLSFSIDSTDVKKVPVVLDAVFEYKKNFFQHEPILPVPDSVTLSGPKQELDRIDSIKTVRKEFKDIDGPLSELLPLQTTGFEHVAMYPDKIAINLLAEQYTEKRLNLPITTLNAPQGLQINPSSVTVHCTVSLNKYDDLTSDSIEATVDLKNVRVTKGPTVVPIQLSHPEWIRSFWIEPKTVEFLIVE